MTNTTEEIIARIGNVAHQMAGELSTRNRSMFGAEHVEAIDADLAELRARLRSATQWQPISSIHEDYGDCVLVNVVDCGLLRIGSCLDLDFDQSDWTHFTRFAPIGQDEYERMKAEAGICLSCEGLGWYADGDFSKSPPEQVRVECERCLGTGKKSRDVDQSIDAARATESGEVTRG